MIAGTTLKTILSRLEKVYGRQAPSGPDDPYEMVLYRNAGYPQSEANCARGFAALKRQVGLAPIRILRASDAALRGALKAGGIVPELRAERVREIARRVLEEYDGDLLAELKRVPARAKTILASFPTVAEAGAERILLFSGLAPVAALPSNAVHVPLRIGYGRESKSWRASYRSAQQAVEAELPRGLPARRRAWLLFARHGLETCKRTTPLCDDCVINTSCEYARRNRPTGRSGGA